MPLAEGCYDRCIAYRDTPIVECVCGGRDVLPAAPLLANGCFKLYIFKMLLSCLCGANDAARLRFVGHVVVAALLGQRVWLLKVDTLRTLVKL